MSTVHLLLSNSILLLLFCFGTRRRKHLPTIYLRKENRPWLCVVLYPLLKFRFGSVVFLECYFPSRLFQGYLLDRREHILWKKGIYAPAASMGCEPLDGKWRSEIWPQGGLLVLHKVSLALRNDTKSPFQSFSAFYSTAGRDRILSYQCLNKDHKRKGERKFKSQNNNPR
jgi:hypothetical protein